MSNINRVNLCIDILDASRVNLHIDIFDAEIVPAIESSGDSASSSVVDTLRGVGQQLSENAQWASQRALQLISDADERSLIAKRATELVVNAPQLIRTKTLELDTTLRATASAMEATLRTQAVKVDTKLRAKASAIKDGAAVVDTSLRATATAVKDSVTVLVDTSMQTVAKKADDAMTKASNAGASVRKARPLKQIGEHLTNRGITLSATPTKQFVSKKWNATKDGLRELGGWVSEPQVEMEIPAQAVLVSPVRVPMPHLQ